MKTTLLKLIVNLALTILIIVIVSKTVMPLLSQAAPLAQAPKPITKFEDVTDATGLTFTGAQFGSSWGDYNGDGWLDIFGNHHFQDAPGIYLNNRNGTFTNMYDSANIFPPSERDGVFPPNGTPIRDMHGSCWGDFDNDGDLDLYVTNAQLQITPFYVNQGDGTFKRDTSGQLDDLGGRGRTCSWIDVDNDGDLDLFKGNETNSKPNIIFRNDGPGQNGQWKFTGVPMVAGATTNPLSAYGGAWADYDNDGDMDVVLTGEQDIKLFRNNGDGTFDSTDNKGLLGGGSSFRCWGGDFGDYNNDGHLDLYVSCGRYTFFDNLEQATQSMTYTLLTSNEEDGFNFTVADGAAVTFDVLTGDGDPEVALSEIYIGVNKTHPVALPFTLTSGAAGGQGQPSYTPGTSSGVFIWQDLATNEWRFRVSNESASQGQIRTSAAFTQVELFSVDSLAGQARRNNALYKNNGDGTFTLIGNAIAGVNSPADSQSGTWLDYDNDGWLDLYVVNSGNVSQGNEPNLLYRNNHNGSFTDVAAAAGVTNAVQGYDDCAAWGDYDHNGFVDLYVVKDGRNRYMDGPQKLYRNLGNSNHWLQVNLIGTTSNRQGIGAKVTLQSATVGQQFRNKNNGMNFMCQNSDILQFGLGADSKVTTLTVKWPSGQEQNFINVAADQILTIIEGQMPTQPVVSVASDVAAPSETGAVGSLFNLTFNPAPATDITVAYSLTGTASKLADYSITVGANVTNLSDTTFMVSAGITKATLLVKPIDDRVDDDAETVQLVLVVGAGYQLSPVAQTAFLTIVDDDDFVGGLVITPTTGLTTTEAGGQAKFSVMLDVKPKATVTVPISSSDVTKGTVSPASLTFGALDWNIPQTVTVMGGNDFIDQDDASYLVQLGPTRSNDKSFNQLSPYTVSVVSIDDDTAGFMASAISGDMSENGISATFTVRLTSQPLAEVTLPMSSSDITEGIITPTLLAFSPLDWRNLQTVTVTGLDDDEQDGNKVFAINLGPSVSNDPKYTGLNATPVTVVNLDNDLPGQIIGRVTSDDFQISARAAMSMADITVIAYRASGANWLYAAHGESDVNGVYTLTVAAGNYRLYYFDRLARVAYLYYGQTITFKDGVSVTVRANQITPNINASLTVPRAPMVKISGEVSSWNNPYNRRVEVFGEAESGMTVAFEATCTAPATPSQVTLSFAGQAFPMSLANGLYQAILTLPASLSSSSLDIQWLCGSQNQLRTVGQVTRLTTNSWGQVTDARSHKPIEGAKISLYQLPLARPDTLTQTGDCRINGAWESEPPVTVTLGVPLNPEVNGTITPAINSITVASQGQFAWTLGEGCWYVLAQAVGYESQTSPAFGVPPVMTKLQIELQHITVIRPVYLPLIRR